MGRSFLCFWLLAVVYCSILELRWVKILTWLLLGSVLVLFYLAVIYRLLSCTILRLLWLFYLLFFDECNSIHCFCRILASYASSLRISISNYTYKSINYFQYSFIGFVILIVKFGNWVDVLLCHFPLRHVLPHLVEWFHLFHSS